MVTKGIYLYIYIYIEPFTSFLGHLSRCLVVWGVLIFPSPLFTEVSFQKSSQATTTSRRSSAMARTFRWTTWTCRRRRKPRRKRWNHPRRKRRSRKWNGWELPMWVDNEVSGMVRMWWCTYRLGYLFFFGKDVPGMHQRIFLKLIMGKYIGFRNLVAKSIETTRRHITDWYSDTSLYKWCFNNQRHQHLKNNGGLPSPRRLYMFPEMPPFPVRFQARFER